MGLDKYIPNISLGRTQRAKEQKSPDKETTASSASTASRDLSSKSSPMPHDSSNDAASTARGALKGKDVAVKAQESSNDVQKLLDQEPASVSQGESGCDGETGTTKELTRGLTDTHGHVSSATAEETIKQLQMKNDQLVRRQEELEERTRSMEKQESIDREAIESLRRENNDLTQQVTVRKEDCDILEGFGKRLRIERDHAEEAFTKLHHDHQRCLKQKDDSSRQFIRLIGADSIQGALQLWEEKENRLQDAERKLEALQTQLLQNVDRYSPEFDAKVQQSFIMLNKRITTLVADKDVYAVFAKHPCRDWPEDFWFPKAVRIEIRQKKVLDRSMLKLLLRQSIWKLLSCSLFEKGQPFSAFGGTLPPKMMEIYWALFHDHETNEQAAKWRADSAKYLLDRFKDDAELQSRDQQSLLETLRGQVVRHFQTGLGTTETSGTDSIARVFAQVERTKKKVDAVLSAAVELAQTVALQRAAYTLDVPALDGEELCNGRKEVDDTLLTNVGGDVGIDGDDDIDERAGKVALIASPILFKWGDSKGSNLGHRNILKRAYAVLESQE